MPARNREDLMSSRAVHIVATTNTGVGGFESEREVESKRDSVCCRPCYSNPYSTAMRHASLALLLVEACCRRERGEEKPSSQAGHECALGVERVDLRGVWKV